MPHLVAMKDNKSNKDMLIRLKKGDMRAFDALYNKYCKRLHAFVLKFVKREAEADDIIQEVFLKIWEARSKIDVYTILESFLFTIAYNTTMSQLRKKVHETKYREYLKSIQKIETADKIINELHFKELNQNVQLLLNQLTPRQKEIFLLSREQGHTHQEIAKKLNISVNTVKNHMIAALSFLKKEISNSLIINILFVFLFF